METALNVTQLNTYIKQIFDSEVLLSGIRVMGEISGYSVSKDIAYFSIKDENCLLSCVLFSASKFITPKNGDMVVLTGSVKFYAKGGRLNFNATKIEPYGQGLLFQKFLEMKDKLGKEGLFDQSHKKAIPQNIKRIGVVTSKTGAVIQDIINVGSRRNNTIEIVLYPVRVQGEGAENEIANGINFFSSYNNVDVVIVARGGGSAEDLQAFNTEIVARSAFNCLKPLVSAVGHETDFSILDFVSDLRAPTPSAAAELLFNDLNEFNIKLKNLMLRISSGVTHNFSLKENELSVKRQKLSNIADKLISTNENNLYVLKNNLIQSIDQFFLKKSHQIENMGALLEGLNPEKILKLGYATIKKGKENIVSVKDVNVGDKIFVKLKDGEIESNVIGVK